MKLLSAFSPARVSTSTHMSCARTNALTWASLGLSTLVGSPLMLWMHSLSRSVVPPALACRPPRQCHRGEAGALRLPALGGAAPRAAACWAAGGCAAPPVVGCVAAVAALAARVRFWLSTVRGSGGAATRVSGAGGCVGCRALGGAAPACAIRAATLPCSSVTA